MAQHESSNKFTTQQLIRTLAFPSAFILSGAMVWGGSTAAFSDTTVNTNNSWNTGAVEITNDRQDMADSAMFSASNIVPGYEETRCITVTSNSTVDTEVSMYGSVFGDALLTESMILHVADGTALSTADGSCDSFDGTNGTSFSGSLGSFYKEYTDDGALFTALAPEETRSYRITVSLPVGSESPSLSSAQATFTWEARSIPSGA